MADPIEVDKVTVRDLATFVGRLTVGSAMTVVGLLGSVVTATLFVAPYFASKSSELSGLAGTAIESLIDQGLSTKQKYILPSVISWTRLDRDVQGRLIGDQRIVYSALALTAIGSNDAAFQEGYHSAVTNLQYMPGSEPDEALNEPQEQALGWNVPLTMAAGESRAIMTGVRRIYRPDGLSRPRLDHASRELGPQEDEYCYRNETDVVGQITIGVESTLDFSRRLGLTQTEPR